MEVTTISQFSHICEHFESLGINIRINSRYFNIIGVYRSPSSSLLSFNNEFFPMINVTNGRLTTFIMGDFNVDCLSETPCSTSLDFFDKFNSHSYFQLIDIPTRVTDVSSSCIDHIYVNSMSPIISGVIDVSVSDHFGIFCSVPNVMSNENFSKTIKFRDHSIQCIESFQENLMQELLNFYIYDDFGIDDRFEIFNNILIKNYNKCCPIKTKNISLKHLGSPWITDSLIACIKEKHRLRKLSRNNLINNNIFKSYSVYLRNLINASKYSYYKNKFNSLKRDPKSTWKLINNILNPNSTTKDLHLNQDNECIKRPDHVAEIFKDHFSNVASKLRDKIPPVLSDPCQFIARSCNTFVYFPTSNYEIDKIISSLKSKPSPLNVIPSYIFKKLSTIISPFLRNLINNSVSYGIFPNCLKNARVIPIYKSGCKKSVENYRPISTLPFLSKIFERVINDRVNNFFEKYKLFCDDQFGFRKHRSTTDALLKFTDACLMNFNKKNYLVSLFLDYSKAFDTVDHGILCRKLELYGIRGFMNDWFKSYLQNRSQYISIKGSSSTTSYIQYGVPQGSVLGSLLFSIYINDMHKSSPLNFLHYADDTTIYYSDVHLPPLMEKLESECERVFDWICANQLSLNLLKTFYVIFTNNQINYTPSLCINNVNIASKN